MDSGIVYIVTFQAIACIAAVIFSVVTLRRSWSIWIGASAMTLCFALAGCSREDDRSIRRVIQSTSNLSIQTNVVVGGAAPIAMEGQEARAFVQWLLSDNAATATRMSDGELDELFGFTWQNGEIVGYSGRCDIWIRILFMNDGGAVVREPLFYQQQNDKAVIWWNGGHECFITSRRKIDVLEHVGWGKDQITPPPPTITPAPDGDIGEVRRAPPHSAR